ncbi:phosphoribosylaminoimidazolesuccinocarboxamide synthase [Synechococcus sp. PCC 6312]|uniref:phosphoribosylaminoimidazolesuccinocarboxamide synthase n=1 Tax=Synechococcus sp. (strain ATCC 27167 / PCC 6312) TaxID=195253 RepID=UPI00029F47AF|nr:phosphoribosylaminoimidazolesuccinocarboxamide synthase [Synechococcus sp. PCC 6312]AFY60183.1 phosphoribosylaminoimidazole-succinocarboxamide synthase [Synechococcus sp. PCC 6312]
MTATNHPNLFDLAPEHKLYEGKAKIIYKTPDPQVLLAYFKDDATAFNAQKKGAIVGKGRMNCQISSHLFRYLAHQAIASHFMDQLAPDVMQVQAVEIIPLEVVVRNRAAGSLCKQTGLELGLVLPVPLVEFYLKDDALGDPLLTPDRLSLLDLASAAEIAQLRGQALKINSLLTHFFQDCGITLVDFKLEFGRNPQGKILLADEISPDTCRLWNQAESDTNRRVMDKDRFRQDLGDIEAAYKSVMERVLAQEL